MAVAEALNKLMENFARMQSQPLTASALSTINWFDGTDKSNTMSWLDHMEVVAERNNQTPLEVGMAKLKGAPLCDTHKTHDLTWPQLRKLLIENYSDTPYISDVVVTYNRISQTKNKSVSQYLMHAKDYLEYIYHISRLSSMDSSGLNHISLVQDLSNSYVRRRASNEAENWRMMAGTFESITKIAKMAGKTKTYNEPRYEVSTDINAISHQTNSQRGSLSRHRGSHKSISNSNRTNTHAGSSPHKQGNTKEPICCHCKGPHYITNYSKYQQDNVV